MAPTINRGKKSNKSPPIFSHEFVIQNHGDIVSCLTMVAIAGLFFEVGFCCFYIFRFSTHKCSSVSEYVPFNHLVGGVDKQSICFIVCWHVMLPIGLVSFFFLASGVKITFRDQIICCQYISPGFRYIEQTFSVHKSNCTGVRGSAAQCHFEW